VIDPAHPERFRLQELAICSRIYCAAAIHAPTAYT
jgi:hypothetical protein